MIRSRQAVCALALLCACTTAGKTPTPLATDATRTPAGIGVEGATLDVRLTRDERGMNLVLARPADVVWAAIPGVYEELGIEPELIDTPSRQYGSNAVTGLRVAGIPMSEVARCGAQATGLQATTRMRVRLTVITTVTPLDDRSSVLSTRVTGQGSRIDGTSTGSSDCVSTGKLEERIAGHVRLETGG
jgi:hypothetical protein